MRYSEYFAQPVKFLRLYYNYFLVKWDFRKVLPAYFVNRIEVADCGEELVQYQGVWVRRRVAVMLDNAQRALPPHLEIKVVSGFRDSDEQRVLQMKFPDSRKVAAESGHSTGGAVDVILHYCGKEIDCGSSYLEFTPLTPTWSNMLSRSQQRNRFILYNAMIQAGFVNYPLEWWHFCYGDKMYAAYHFEKQAFYGKAEIPWQPALFKTE